MNKRILTQESQVQNLTARNSGTAVYEEPKLTFFQFSTEFILSSSDLGTKGETEEKMYYLYAPADETSDW